MAILPLFIAVLLRIMDSCLRVRSHKVAIIDLTFRGSLPMSFLSQPWRFGANDLTSALITWANCALTRYSFPDAVQIRYINCIGTPLMATTISHLLSFTKCHQALP
jgi:hypothetical protein